MVLRKRGSEDKSTARQPGGLNAWLGPELEMEGGLLRFKGSLRIDGRVLDADLEGALLVVGDAAKVSGRLVVDQLEIFGRLEGSVVVRESVRVAPGGFFEGEMRLERPVLAVEDGATFHGRVKMG